VILLVNSLDIAQGRRIKPARKDIREQEEHRERRGGGVDVPTPDVRVKGAGSEDGCGDQPGRV